MTLSIGIISIKGGVGKTTIASSLATDLAQRKGKKVLLIDTNYSAPNLGLYMDIVEPAVTIHEVLAGKARITSAVHQCYGVDVIPGSYVFEQRVNMLKLKNRIANFKKDYDFVILDSSPSLNDELLSTILASDFLFLVATPDYPTLSTSLKAVRLAKHRGAHIAGIILNKVRDPSHELNLREIEETIGIPVVARIPDEKVHGRAIFARIPLSLYSPKSVFAREISELSETLIGKVKRPGFFTSLFSFALRKERVNRALLKEQFYTPYFAHGDIENNGK